VESCSSQMPPAPADALCGYVKIILESITEAGRKSQRWQTRQCHLLKIAHCRFSSQEVVKYADHQRMLRRTRGSERWTLNFSWLDSKDWDCSTGETACQEMVLAQPAEEIVDLTNGDFVKMEGSVDSIDSVKVK
jgi:hypothetical protein